MQFAMLLVVAVVAVFASSISLCNAEIDASRTITHIDKDTFGFKVDLDGCKKKDEYGCASMSAEFGKNISGTVQGELKKDLEKGSHFIASLHIKTGIFPVPFKIQCPLCGSKCSFKIPILEKEIDVQLPPCPLKASAGKKAFNQVIPSKDPIPIELNVDGIVNVYDDKGTEIAAVHFSARVKKPMDQEDGNLIESLLLGAFFG